MMACRRGMGMPTLQTDDYWVLSCGADSGMIVFMSEDVQLIQSSEGQLCGLLD